MRLCVNYTGCTTDYSFVIIMCHSVSEVRPTTVRQPIQTTYIIAVTLNIESTASSRSFRSE